jgi:hypothetical protein
VFIHSGFDGHFLPPLVMVNDATVNMGAAVIACFYKQGFNGSQSCPLAYVLYIASFSL